MTKAAGLALACLLLTTCGAPDAEIEAGPSASTTSSASTTTSASASPTPSPVDARLGQAIAICTDGMVKPDTLIGDAIDAARAGTRSVSEIADAFRLGQDAAEELAAEAGSADFPDLAEALQAYADVLGRARVSGDAGLPDMTDAREAINTACLTAAVDQ
jgi:hypothetical protein